MRTTKHPAAIKALSGVLNEEFGLPYKDAVPAAVRIMDRVDRLGVAIIPKALIEPAWNESGRDPFLMIADMADAIEEAFGRKPWLPE